MFKKITSLIMVFLLCCLTPIAAFSEAGYSPTEENDPSSDNVAQKDHALTDSNANTNETTTFQNVQMRINPEYLITIQADPEYLEMLRSAPDEILSASTIELLEYFIQTPFMQQEAHPMYMSSLISYPHIDYTSFEAFRELIARDDFTDALEMYAANICDTSMNNLEDIDTAAFEMILGQASVISIMSSPTYNAADHPNIQRVFDAVTTS